MQKPSWRWFAVFLVIQLFGSNSLFAAPQDEHVILLHGGLITSFSMLRVQYMLENEGYHVHNVNYPSRAGSIKKLADDAIAPAIVECERAGAVKISFVTHSMGAILLRSYLASHSVSLLGRVVMLGPPNHGSEVADKLGHFWVYKKIFGPTMLEMTTATNSLPNTLGAANFCLGIIAGDRTIGPISSFLIPGRDDGMISIERTKLAGMADHLVMHTTHPFMTINQEVIRQAIYFLKNGRFNHEVSSKPWWNRLFKLEWNQL